MCSPASVEPCRACRDQVIRNSKSAAPFVSSFGYAVPVARVPGQFAVGGIGLAPDPIPEWLIRDAHDVPSLSA
jgi:hypothetical protein